MAETYTASSFGLISGRGRRRKRDSRGGRGQPRLKDVPRAAHLGELLLVLSGHGGGAISLEDTPFHGLTTSIDHLVLGGKTVLGIYDDDTLRLVFIFIFFLVLGLSPYVLRVGST